MPLYLPYGWSCKQQQEFPLLNHSETDFNYWQFPQNYHPDITVVLLVQSAIKAGIESLISVSHGFTPGYVQLVVRLITIIICRHQHTGLEISNDCPTNTARASS
jgi:hypothetical protein